jgi:hypothetical protein
MKAADAYRALRIAYFFHIIPESAGIKPRFDTSPCSGEPWLLEIYSSSILNKIRRALHIKIKSDHLRIDAMAPSLFSRLINLIILLLIIFSLLAAVV